MNFINQEVYITDVTARDGFQMERKWIPTSVKIDIINKITAAGIKRIEAAAFVSPQKVPQMRDAEEVITKIKKRESVKTTALAANVRGAERALASGIDEIQAVLSVSETHNMKNVNKDVNSSIREIAEMAELTKQRGKVFNVSISTAFGCTFEGLMPVEKTIRIIEALADHEISLFVLSDTTGMANPKQTYLYLIRLQKEFPRHNFGLHFHNTRGLGMANVTAGFEAGVTRFDAAVGGIGGCPFTPKAAGNVCTEDMVYMFAEMGVKTAIDVDKLIELAQEIEALLGRTLPGYMMKAGKATKAD